MFTNSPAFQKKETSSQENQDTGQRLRFWEIECCFVCPLVGTGLTLAEQKQLLKKTGLDLKRSTQYEMHEVLVGCAKKESPLSRRVDTLLQRKYGKEADTLLRLSNQDLAIHCKKAVSSDLSMAAIWAAATSPDLELEAKKQIFGLVHMNMHQSAKQYVQLQAKLTRQEKELNVWRQKYKTEVRSRKTLQRENKQIQQDKMNLQSKLNAAETKKHSPQQKAAARDQDGHVLQDEQARQVQNQELQTLEQAWQDKEQQVQELLKQNQKLKHKLQKQQKMFKEFKEQAQEIMAQIMPQNHCDQECPAYDLCQKRILMVGGITKMQALFREIVEGNGGIFDYHDGYVRKGGKQLESSLKRADIVLCPVNCNSHGACSIVKNLAKKHRKKVYLLENSSLSTVSQAIHGAGQQVKQLN